MLLLHVRVLVPDDWMLVGSRLHETPVGDVTASVTVSVKPFCGEMVIVSVAEVPLLKLRDVVLVVRETSGVPITVTSTIVVCSVEPDVPFIDTV